MTAQLTAKQREALKLCAGPATHVLLEGGGRSGKTVLQCRKVIERGCKAPGASAAILRFRFNHAKTTIAQDTFPATLRMFYPDLDWRLDRTDWYFSWKFDGMESRVWVGGLDDKERTEKILGQEHATIYLNEVSQIPWASRNMALSRLAQKVDQRTARGTRSLRLRIFYDLNPTNKNHWGYQAFHRKLDPLTKQPLPNPSDYAWMRINPEDNIKNINPDYLEQLRAAGGATLKRFLKGEWQDANPNALFHDEKTELYRNLGDEVPPLIRVGVAVDPSGADEDDADQHDEIGIVVGGLGADGNGYLLEDLTVSGGPDTWSRIVADAYERHAADFVAAETNYGGAMVRHVIQTQNTRIPFRKVTATRGKVVRAEPIAGVSTDVMVRPGWAAGHPGNT